MPENANDRIVRLFLWLLAPWTKHHLICCLFVVHLLLLPKARGHSLPADYPSRLACLVHSRARTGQCRSVSALQSMSWQSNDAAPLDESLDTKRNTSATSNDNKDLTTAKRTRCDDGSQAAAAVEFARLLGGLKVTPRTGWVRRGVPKYESVADHSWRVAALSLLLPSDFDVIKCMAMAVVHDVAESVIGDICPDDNVSKEDKVRMEAQAMEKIASTLSRACGSSHSVHQLTNLFHEYEKRESKEAVSVKDLDLLDMIVQAAEYEARFGLDLGEFFDGTPVSRFRTPALQKVAQEVHNQREARMQAQVVHDGERQGDEFSKSDAAFVSEFSKASRMSTEDVERVVKAMRTWEKKPKDET